MDAKSTLAEARECLKTFKDTSGVVTLESIKCAVGMRLRMEKQTKDLLVDILVQEFNI